MTTEEKIAALQQAMQTTIFTINRGDGPFRVPYQLKTLRENGEATAWQNPHYTNPNVARHLTTITLTSKEVDSLAALIRQEQP